MKVMISLLICSSTLLLCSCGTFQLASNVYAPAGKTGEEQQSDTLFCKDQANLAVNSGAHQTGDFLLGFTIIGAPVAYQMDKNQEREAFAQCMMAKGYSVVMPDGSLRQASNAPTNVSNVATVASSQYHSGISFDLPAGWITKQIPSNLAAEGIFLLAANYAIDSGVAVSSISRSDIADFKAYAGSREQSQVSRLSDAQASKLSEIEVNGQPAYRFTVTGVINGIRITYLHTFVEGQSNIVDVNAWTSSSNFPTQQSTLTSLSTRVTGA